MKNIDIFQEHFPSLESYWRSIILDEETFKQIFVPIDEYARAMADISHIAGMRLMLHLLCSLEK